MRSVRALTLLFVAGAVAWADAGVSAWEQQIAGGILADDTANYAEAERLFSLACDLKRAESLGSERLTQGCLLLSRTYSVQGKLVKAAKTTDDLFAALEYLEDPRAVDLVQTLIEAASIQAARADFVLSDKTVAAAVRLCRQLRPMDQARAFAELASFYVPADKQARGGNFLRASVGAIKAWRNWNDLDFARTAVDIGRTLKLFQRSSEALEVLVPVAEAARLRADSAPEFDELWRHYSAAVDVAVPILRSRGDAAEADRLLAAKQTWPQAPLSPLKLQPGDVAPQFERKAAAPFSLGADRRNVQGTVVLAAEIRPDGRAHNLRVIRPLPYGLTWSAIGSVRKWRFRPGLRDGKPVSINVQIEVEFRAPERQLLTSVIPE